MALDPREYWNDPEEAQRLVLDGRQATMWTAMPGIVQSVDLTAMTCVVQLALQGRYEDQSGQIHWVNIKPLQDVPIVFPSAGGFTVTMPMAANDEVLVVIASRCIDSWWQNGGYKNQPIEFRMHDLSDGFAIPGPKSQPNVISAISSTDLQIRNNAGTTYLSIGADGKIGFKNAATDLKTVLTNLETALSAFMTTLAGFGGGGSPVTQAMLQAPASTCATALTTVLTEIGALLK
jgi:hypothetical protein